MKLNFPFLIIAAAVALSCQGATAEDGMVINDTNDYNAHNNSKKVSPMHKLLLHSILTTRAEELADSHEDKDHQPSLESWWNKKNRGNDIDGKNDDAATEKFFEDPVTVMIRKGVNVSDLGMEEKSFMSDALLFSFNQIHDANDKDYHGLDAKLVGTGHVQSPDENMRNTPAGNLRLGYRPPSIKDFYIFSMRYRCCFCPLYPRSGSNLFLIRQENDNVKSEMTATSAKLNLHKEWEKSYCRILVNSGLPFFENADHCLIQTVDNYMLTTMVMQESSKTTEAE